jgi:immunoglobulin-binding protein 1
MKAFEEAMKQDSTDEEAKRNFYISKIRWWINTAFDDLGYLHGKFSIKKKLALSTFFHLDELRVLLQRQSIDSTNDEESHRRPGPSPQSSPLKPFVITRGQLQSQAFGVGYPSASTMTIDEFYESLAKRGLAPTPEQSKAMAAGPKFPSASDIEKEDIMKETYIEKDDPDMVRYLRSTDEYKDDHRRGEGNRHNRS